MNKKAPTSPLKLLATLSIFVAITTSGSASEKENFPSKSETSQKEIDKMGELIKKMDATNADLEKNVKSLEGMGNAVVEMAEGMYMVTEAAIAELSAIPEKDLTNQQRNELKELRQAQQQMRRDIEKMKADLSEAK